MTDADRSQFLITERRCSVCMSPVRADVDQMLLGEQRKPDDVPYTYDEIVQWAAERGVKLTPSSLSRHRHNHLQPAVVAAIETQRYMDAMAKATGRKLSLHSAVANVIASKTLRMLNDLDLADMKPGEVLRVAMRAAEVSLKIEQVERLLTEEVVQQIDATLVKSGLDPETLAKVREIYGIAS